MILEEIQADILKVSDRLINEGKKVVIVHGCNCFHTMGAGIALYLRRKHPNILIADKSTKYGNKSKLGNFSYSTINDNLVIANCYTQFNYGRDKINVDQSAIFNSIKNVCNYFPDRHIVMPRIGCGLAGGDWKEIKHIVNSALNDMVATVCYM